MKPAEIPQELLDILDAAAGREHARTGTVAGCLAAILGRYDELKAEAWHQSTTTRIGQNPETRKCWRCCKACQQLNPYFEDARNSLLDTAPSTENPDHTPDVEPGKCVHLKTVESAGTPGVGEAH